MPKTTLSQFSFNRGELDPVLHGRSDWKYYYSGAEVLKNLITRPQGGAVKRGGLRLVAPALDDAGPSALVPFRFSVEQSYMLEFGHQRMRIIKDGGVVTYPAGHEREGEEVVVDTPYPAAALKDLRHAQTSDVMILTHADFAPRRLARYDHHDWRFSNLIASVRTATPTGLRITLSGGDDARYVVTAVSASGESPPTDAVVAEPSGRISYQIEGKSFTEMYYWLRERSVNHLPEKLRLEDRVAAQLFLQDAGYQSRDRGIYRDGGETVWMFSRPDGTPGEARWSLTFQPLIDEAVYACEMGWAGNVKPQLEAGIASYVQDYNSALPRSGVTGLAWSAVTGATGYRIYRESGSGADKLFRRIGEATATSFRDEKLPAGTTVLPDEEDPFTGQDRYPGVCAFFEQRLILGRTNKQPTTFWGSETGVYNSFAVSTPLKDSDSYEFTLSSGEMNAINWIVPLNDMLLGTSGGEWKAGGGGQAITPTNINARLQSWYGCSPLPPVVVGRTVIFASRSRTTVRNFTYSLEADGYSGNDLTVYASHLFSGKAVVAMCHQQEPSGIVWAVLSDGTLVSCTYAPEENVVAWSRHTTAGRFENCGSLVDMDGSDQIYFIVSRDLPGGTRRFIETLETPADSISSVEEGFFLDSGLTYRGAPANRISGLDHLNGTLVSCLADGCVFENLLVENGAVELPDGFSAAVIHAGLPYETELITMEMEPEDDESLRNRPRFLVAASLKFVNTRQCKYGQPGGMLSELKFRTNENPGLAIRLYSGEKQVAFTTPPGARTARLRFINDTPTPFALLGIIAEASCGQPA